MKVLFFDSWLKGVSNYTRLMPEIAQRPGVEVKMLHTASWRTDDASEAPEVTTIDNLECVDISHYGTNSLYKVLKRERPDVLVTLNMYNFTDRALVAICRNLGIRIVYLAHGRFSLTNATDISTMVESRRRQKSWKQKLNRENRRMFGNYALATLHAGKPWRFPIAMYKYFTDPSQRSVNTPYCPELRPDKILLYYESDRKIMVENRRFPDDNIQVVGNPELDTFASAPIISREEFCEKYGVPDKPYLLYLDDGLPQNKLLTSDAWKSHVLEISEAAKSQGLALVIKLHPRVDAQEIGDFLRDNGILWYQKDIDFKNLIYHSHAATSIYSSTIAFALLLGKRVVSPRWGDVRDFPLSYPADVVRYAYSPQEFASALSDTAPTCTNSAYLSANFGDLSSPAIPRIVAAILHP